jgi:anti-sigma B factor antagonist/stage II sporulation protein AA (anti-sigma F factor antagonist)
MPSDRTTSPSENSKNNELIITLTGEYDLSNIKGLHDELAKATNSAASTIIVDMAGTTFIDSSGLAELVSARNGLTPERTLVISHLRPNVKKVFEITGLLSLFGIEE